MRSVYEVIAEIEDRLGKLPEMKLHKLCYLAQGWHMAWSQSQLFSEDIEAWEMGPVVRDAWRDRKHNPHLIPDVSRRRPLSASETKTVTYICMRYGRKTGKALSDLTHEKHTAWSAAWSKHGSKLIQPAQIVSDFKDDPAREQGWFWDEEWLAGEVEASKEIKAGGTVGAKSVDEFFDELESTC